MHLAIGVLPDNRGVFEVELLLLLGCLHCIQRLVGGRFIEKCRHEEADGGNALLLCTAHVNLLDSLWLMLDE